MNVYDKALLDEQIEGLRARIVEGWQVNRLPTAPVHLASCDDYLNKFTWYEILEPTGVHYGIVCFEDPIDL